MHPSLACSHSLWRCVNRFAVKEVAKLGNMNDASTGMLSSYALIIMVVHYLQQVDRLCLRHIYSLPGLSHYSLFHHNFVDRTAPIAFTDLPLFRWLSRPDFVPLQLDEPVLPHLQQARARAA